MFADAATGFLELALGRVDAALAMLEAAERRAGQHGLEEPTQIPWAPDLVEALVRAGRRDDAVRVHERLAEQAANVGTAGAHALAARCAGLVAEDDWDEHFAARPPSSRARRPSCSSAPARCSHTVPGLHRGAAPGRRPAPAARGARRLFERLGADHRGRSSPATSCALPAGRPRAPATGSAPAELRVAEAVARGATNREVGDRAVPQPEDGRVPPRARVPQARRALAHAAHARAAAPGAAALRVRGFSWCVDRPLAGTLAAPFPPPRKGSPCSARR